MSPHRLPRRLSAAVLLLMAGVFMLIGPTAPPASAATLAPSADSGFLSLLNGLRSTLGLRTLALDPQLSDIARAWSVKMADSGTLSHNDSLKAQVGIAWTKVGENVGVGGGTTVIFNALVASAPHLLNMSDPAFNLVGIGTATDAQGRMWTTHVFLQTASGGAVPRPASPKAVAAPARTPAPTAAPVVKAAQTVPAPKPAAAPVTTAMTTTVPPPPTTAPEPLPGAGDAAAAPVGNSLPTVRTAASQPGSLPAPLVAVAGLSGLLVLAWASWLLRRSLSATGKTRESR